jgi:hypothetical protein
MNPGFERFTVQTSILRDESVSQILRFSCNAQEIGFIPLPQESTQE